MKDDDQVMIVANGGMLIRMKGGEISVSGRNTQGVKLMNLDTDDRIVDVARVQKEDDDDAEGAEPLVDEGTEDTTGA